MYHQRTSLNKTTTTKSLTQARTNSPLTARRTLPPSSRFFSQQPRQQQHHHTQNNQGKIIVSIFRIVDTLCSDAVQPYSSDGDVFESNSYDRNTSLRITTCDDGQFYV